MRISREAWYQRIGYTPRVWQKMLDDALDSGQHRIAAGFSFPRGGKSLWAARYVEPLLLQPDHHCWIVAPTYKLGSKEFFYILRDFQNAGWLKWATSVHQDVRGGNMKIEFGKWGSFVEVKSADDPTGLRAEELDSCILAEASGLVDESIYLHHLYTRIEKRNGLTLVPTTPKGLNWVYNTFRLPSRPEWRGVPQPDYDKLMYSLVVSADPSLVQPGDPDLADVFEGGVYSMETVARAKRRLPRPIYIEQFGGGFASYAGRIFPYHPLKHKMAWSDLPKDAHGRPHIPFEWTHCVGWDHGASPDETAILVFSYDPQGRTYWWGEVYTAGKSAGEYLGMVRAILGGRVATQVGIDPSAKQVRIELSRYGFFANIPHDKHVDAGIVRLCALMQEDKFKIVEGRPFWPQNLEKELLNLQWDETRPGKVREGQKDHAVSAARYGSLMAVDLPELIVEAIEDPATARMNLFFKQRRAKEQEDRDLSPIIEALEDEDIFKEIAVGEPFDPFAGE